MIKDAVKIVIKVGSSTLTHPSGMLNIRRIEQISKVLCDLRNSGRQPVLVSSGAVSAGWSKMGLRARPSDTAEKQAAAAVGQCELMNMYDRNIISYGHVVAQILLTRDAVDDPARRANAESTFRLLLERGCIPIVNENDSVSCDEIKFSGNDILSARVALLCGADLLINLSDVDGLYDRDPRRFPGAELIKEVRDIDSVSGFGGEAGTDRGTGGMKSKLEAAQIVTSAGIPMIIACGSDPDILYDILDGRSRGTIFYPKGQ